MDKLQAARSAREIARTSGTNAKLDRAWSRWADFLTRIELNHDEFLDNLTDDDKIRILGAFAQAIREREFSRAGQKDLASGTCREAVDKVAEVFRANRRRDPRHDHSGKIDDGLQLQFRGYSNTDPPPKQEKAISPSFFRQHFHRSTTTNQKALSVLAIAAFFWACRSCEYLKAASARKTKLCQLKHIRFFVGNRELLHQDPNLLNAERVTWTFEEQKNAEKNITIPHDNNNDPLMNPVRALATTVQRILSYPGTSSETSICTYMHEGKILEFTQNDLLTSFRSCAGSIGKDKLGFTPEEIGTHSTRSAAAMAMFMDDTPVFMIMLMGRWSSDAFLKYIRRQVLEFSKGMSLRMIKNDFLFTIPAHRASHADPRSQNTNSFATNLSMAPSSNRQNIRPAFSLWH